ncbi:hypothetical protein JCGZ_04107 [Jatropha curcas]|uniref:Protein FLX-like 4 n=1 Tax=Jatropha curcas TaxID=180498 RepID=A0A067L3W6_JATCU|nr:protein FLX-like 4 [Jatropha curcas]KDP38754.1 hypothetical protein JCGZ_04107 [Jatropha curcas]
MAGRRHIPPILEGRAVQAPGLMRHGPFPPGHRPSDGRPPPDLLENKIASQAAEIEQLAGDNHKLATSHVALRQDLVVVQQEVERLKAHIRSIQTESDIQIRVILDKTTKMESEIRAGESVKKDLRQAHMEAQSLVKARQELTTQIQQATQELQKVRADVKSLPDLEAELDNLKHEYRRLRATFEYEKGLNIEKVEVLQAMEQNLIGMAREVEKLHAEVLNAEKRVHAPNTYGGGFATSDPSYPTPVHGAGTYVDAYGRPVVQMSVGPAADGMIAYGSGNGASVTGGISGTVASNTGGGVANWGASYDPSLGWK